MQIGMGGLGMGYRPVMELDGLADLQQWICLQPETYHWESGGIMEVRPPLAIKHPADCSQQQTHHLQGAQRRPRDA